ncbi:hypothetical protein DFH08DRAFT_1085956 [Mycena albidolilacea]|uniref:Uncharacterized protein n=1 Tax=Mycena albidolilacea TaxID=1033008 RepID=A0AAD7EH36_9AGAR|nr:hypothetical protein DFH08DRAFT_1085956 [Mycena albidolilacea]
MAPGPNLTRGPVQFFYGLRTRIEVRSSQHSLSAVRPPHFLPLRCIVSPPPTFVSVAISLSRATAIPVTVQDSNVDNVARAPAPDPDPACRMYACI